jgi:hypothetical protein
LPLAKSFLTAAHPASAKALYDGGIDATRSEQNLTTSAFAAAALPFLRSVQMVDASLLAALPKLDGIRATYAAQSAAAAFKAWLLLGLLDVVELGVAFAGVVLVAVGFFKVVFAGLDPPPQPAIRRPLAAAAATTN